MSESQSQPAQCPACDSQTIEWWDDLESKICSECGYVVQDHEGRDNSIENINIGHSSDSSDQNIKTPWQDRISIKDKSEANLVEVLESVEDVSESLKLSNQVTSRAAEIATDAWETNFMHGRTQELTVGAALYAASREMKSAIPPGAIANEIGVDNSSMKTVYRDLKNTQKLSIEPPTPEEYIGYFCTALSFSDGVAEKAVKLLEENSSPGGTPVGIAAAGTYEAAAIEKEDVSLREVATVATLTKETVWKHAVGIRPE